MWVLIYLKKTWENESLRLSCVGDLELLIIKMDGREGHSRRKNCSN